MEPAAEQRIGQTIAGRYRLLRQVGEGGVGTVYEAEQNLGSSLRSVAVKLLRPEWSHDAAVQARFHREAALVARLQHPNTVRIYDFGATEDGTLYIAMEFLRGRSLQRLLEEQGALPPERAQRIITQVAASLQEAHDQGIVHRDLKPDNILILDSHAGERDVVKLVDFGIAKGQPSSGSALTKLTALGTFVGTPAYMSPEQFSAASVGPESDIYSLGVTSFQMLSGRLPFEAQSAMQWAQAHLSTRAPELSPEHGAGAIPEHTRRAVARALAKEPAERPRSAADFAREFAGPELPAGSDAPAPLAAAVAAAAARRAALHTAPMTRVPELAERPPSGVAPTLPNAVLPAMPAAASVQPPPGRGRGWALAALAGLGVLALAVVALSGERLGLWSAPHQSEQTSSLELPAEPAPVVIEPEPAAPPPVRDPAGASALPPERPSPPPARPSAPKPAQPGATPAPPTLPAGSAGAPGLPPAGPALPGTPALPPGTPVLPPGVSLPEGLPLPPFALPSAQGACERCLEALRKGGNGSVVSAAAENLLCDEREGRARCEQQIREAAPGVAEQAARAGDCPAALATEAAGVHAGASQESFRAVNALCVR